MNAEDVQGLFTLSVLLRADVSHDVYVHDDAREVIKADVLRHRDQMESLGIANGCCWANIDQNDDVPFGEDAYGRLQVLRNIHLSFRSVVMHVGWFPEPIAWSQHGVCDGIVRLPVPMNPDAPMRSRMLYRPNHRTPGAAYKHTHVPGGTRAVELIKQAQWTIVPYTKNPVRQPNRTQKEMKPAPTRWRADRLDP